MWGMSCPICARRRSPTRFGVPVPPTKSPAPRRGFGCSAISKPDLIASLAYHTTFLSMVRRRLAGGHAPRAEKGRTPRFSGDETTGKLKFPLAIAPENGYTIGQCYRVPPGNGRRDAIMTDCRENCKGFFFRNTPKSCGELRVPALSADHSFVLYFTAGRRFLRLNKNRQSNTAPGRFRFPRGDTGSRGL